MAKHFTLTITDDHFAFACKNEVIANETALDGLYVICTSVAEDTMDDDSTVRADKSLSQVERAFRAFKTVDLQPRTLHRRLAPRIWAHVFLCMLAYHVEWHTCQDLAPMLYDETDREAAEVLRDSVVVKARIFLAARTRKIKGQTEDGLPMHSFQISSPGQQPSRTKPSNSSASSQNLPSNDSR